LRDKETDTERERDQDCNVGPCSTHDKMENNSINCSSSTSAASSSIKKLKREAAQRRKAHARSLKLRAEEQERLQRLV